MSRLPPGAIYVRPTANVYTGLAFIAAISTFAALVYVALRFHELGAF